MRGMGGTGAGGRERAGAKRRADGETEGDPESSNETARPLTKSQPNPRACSQCGPHHGDSQCKNATEKN